MEINDKILMELASQMGMNSGNGESKEKMNRAIKIAESMKGLNSDELTEEILKMKSSIKSNPEQFQKQIKTFKALSVMMNDEQKAQLNKVIGVLESE